MQHLEVSCAVRPIKWPLGVKWLKHLKTLQHVSILFRSSFCVKMCAGLCSPAHIFTQNARTHTKFYAAASPH